MLRRMEFFRDKPPKNSFFLKTCCGYSEVPGSGASNEFSQYMILWQDELALY